MNCVKYFREAETENVVADLAGRQEPSQQNGLVKITLYIQFLGKLKLCLKKWSWLWFKNEIK